MIPFVDYIQENPGAYDPCGDRRWVLRRNVIDAPSIITTGKFDDMISYIWNDSNDRTYRKNKPARLDYHPLSIKMIRALYYEKPDMNHRIDGPAIITLARNGFTTSWVINAIYRPDISKWFDNNGFDPLNITPDVLMTLKLTFPELCE